MNNVGYISGAAAAFTPERDLHFFKHIGDVDFASLKHYLWGFFFPMAFSEYSLLQCGVLIRKLRLPLQLIQLFLVGSAVLLHYLLVLKLTLNVWDEEG